MNWEDRYDPEGDRVEQMERADRALEQASLRDHLKLLADALATPGKHVTGKRESEDR